MTLWNRTVKALSSRTLSFALLAAWCGLLAMWVIPFQATGLAEEQVASIATTWLPFRIVHVLVLVTTIACVAVRAPADFRRLRRSLTPPPDPAASLTPDLQSVQMTIEEARGRLAARGWRQSEHGESVTAWRARSSLLGGSAFHFGILLFALAIALNTQLSSTAEFRLIEGERVGLDTGDDPGAVLRGAIADATLVEVRPRYFEDVLLFEQLDAVWKRADGRAETFSLASPHWVDPVTTVSIQDYGLAPRFVVREAGKVVQDTTAAMSIFPPGAEDTVNLTNATMLVTASAFTDHGVVDGKDVSLSYNVGDPRLRIAVSPSDDPGRIIARALLAPGDALTIDHPSGARYELTFAELKRYGSFRVSRSWALPLLVIGGLMMVFGMGLRIWRPRAEMVLWPTADGLSVVVRVDKVGVSAVKVARDALAAESESK